MNKTGSFKFQKNKKKCAFRPTSLLTRSNTPLGVQKAVKSRKITQKMKKGVLEATKNQKISEKIENNQKIIKKVSEVIEMMEK